jgi:hypothetical protein
MSLEVARESFARFSNLPGRKYIVRETTCHEMVEEIGLDNPDETPIDSISHELWSVAQLIEFEGIEDGVERIKNVLRNYQPEFLEKRCSCDEYAKGVSALHDSCRHAALNGKGIDLNHFEFCPWCGGKVGESKTAEEVRLDTLRVVTKQCLEAGWKWQKEGEQDFFLIPPKGDPRCFWAAKWIEIEKGKRVPHWANPEVPKKKE